MKINVVISVALTAAASLAPAEAAVLTYTSKSAFIEHLLPGFYFNDFTSLPENFDTPYPSAGFTNGTPAVGYEVTAPSGGLFRTPAPDVGIGNWHNADALIVTFNTGNVRMIGADFFLLNIDGKRLAGTITVTFSDGTTANVVSYTSGAYGFFGISSDTPISSLTITPAPDGQYINMGSFYASASASVPATTVITSLTRTGATVTIDFATDDGTLTTGSFVLQGAATVNSTFTDLPGAVVSQLPTGFFRVTTTSVAGSQFYRIRQK